MKCKVCNRGDKPFCSKHDGDYQVEWEKENML
jgi:hypothetical protein